MNSRKRQAATAAMPSAATTKKRKMGDAQKFYAVRTGFKPGIYEDYADCQAQTSGFKGAIFKSFTSREDAEAFVAGKNVKSATSGPDKFYAVAVGSPTGIFTDWADAALSIKGVKGPKYKKFASRAEAVDYIKQFGNKETIEALGETATDPLPAAEPPTKKTKASAHTAQEPADKAGEDVLKIYTDGSSLANGKTNSRAGLGVFFGDNDARNLSERLAGEPQTNQRAELTAILRAMEIAPTDRAIQIYTDSKYSINCVTQWALAWEQKGWVTASGAEVKNQDIIRAVLARMKERNKAGANTYFQWVKGHASDKGNIAADALAVRGARLGV